MSEARPLFSSRKEKRLQESVRTLVSIFQQIQKPAFAGWVNDTLYWDWSSSKECIVLFHAGSGEPADTLFCDSLWFAWQTPADTGSWKSLKVETIIYPSALLVSRWVRSRWRYSQFRRYYWIHLTTRKILPLADGVPLIRVDCFFPRKDDGSQLPWCAFSDGTNVGFQVMAPDSPVHWLTHYPSSQDTVCAGTADWVYEEEFALYEHTLQISPDGNWVYWYELRMQTLPSYPLLSGWISLDFPEVEEVRYPRAGGPLAYVQIRVWNRKNSSRYTLSLLGDSSRYIPVVDWTPWNDLMVITLDRLQKHLQIWLCSPDTAFYCYLFAEERDTGTFVQIPESWVWTRNRNGSPILLWMSERDENVRRVYRISSSDEWIPLTPEWMDVLSIRGFDSVRRVLWVEGVDLRDPFRLQAYRIRTDTLVSPLPVVVGKKDHARSVRIQVSPRGTWALVQMSAFLYPPSWAMYHVEDTFFPRYVLADNSYLGAVLKAKIQEGILPSVRWVSYTGSCGGTETFTGWLLLPPQRLYRKGIRPLFRKRPPVRWKWFFPLLLDVYGGPGSFRIRDEWGAYARYSFYAIHGIIVASTEGHGTEGKGVHVRKAIYGQMGLHESEDMKQFLETLRRNYPVDPLRTVITGWSFGGYLAGLCLLRFPEDFRYAIAGAPVTDWRLYDNAYTERYMDHPARNPEGYEKTSWTYWFRTHASRLTPEHRGLLILHGLYDDNVHVQHTLNFIQQILDNASHSTEWIEWILYPQMKHAPGHLHYRDVRNRRRQAIMQWLLQNGVLKKSSGTRKNQH